VNHSLLIQESRFPLVIPSLRTDVPTSLIGSIELAHRLARSGDFPRGMAIAAFL
jgi:hypothetical protein